MKFPDNITLYPGLGLSKKAYQKENMYSIHAHRFYMFIIEFLKRSLKWNYGKDKKNYIHNAYQ